MKGRRRVYRVLSDGVGVVVSTVLTCIVGAVVYPVAGAVLFVVGLTALVVLICGRGEMLAVRLLARARRPRDYELAGLRPAIAVLGEFDLAAPPVQLVVRGGQDQVRVAPAGRRTVVVSQGLVAMAASGRVRPDEIAALLAHAITRIRLGQTRYDVALEFWMLPWRRLQDLGRGIGQLMDWFPLIAIAWRMRLVVGVVALVQGFTQGRAVFGVIGAAVIALSYVVPWADRRAALAGEDEADRFVAAAGLGDALSRFLQRGRPSPRVLQRVHRLQAVPPPGSSDAHVTTS